ncbi:hypothetical protein [Paenibacillus sp. 481]|uniref:hypothetical protein n=1 Tax=Paenibacillus sp. 481 TaxID=2835869 RepID=UPI001E2C7FDB|nr:hypothetical protein [Paenibacillus sp. 481]UHA75102.1 hypothetical protein KIK04_08800 [Paenibacillus sp. 481]
MLKRFTFSLLSVAMLLSIGTGAAFAQEAPKPTVKAAKVEDVQQQRGSLYISWNKKFRATHYQVSLREVNTGKHEIPEEVVRHPRDFFNKAGLPFGKYRVWVGAYIGHPKFGGQLIGSSSQELYISGHQQVHLNP